METSGPLLPTPRANESGNYQKSGNRKIQTLTGAVKNGRSSSREASHASLFPKPDEDAVRKMIATSGLKCYASYASFIRGGSSVKTLVALLLGTTEWFSNRSTLTWKVKVTRSSRLLFQLVPSTHRTAEIASGLLPTATATAYGNNQSPSDGAAVRPSLQTLMKMLPTPATRDYKGASAANPRDTVDSLIEAGATKGQIGARTGLKLQPRFVEWMMGFPDDWTALPDSKLLEMRSSRRSHLKS